jgi:two-component system, cell cycle sensor histidine kinase and response regulator CckA
MSRTRPTDSSSSVKPLNILIAEDDADDLELTVRELKKSKLNLAIDSVSARHSFAQKLNEQPVDIVLSDYRMDGWTGMDAFSEIVKSGKDIPLILVTGTLGDLKAVECIKLGIDDYVLKQQLARLPMAILRAREGKLHRESERKAAEALRESEARFRTLVEHAPDAIVVLDVDSGIFTDCNDNAARLFGLTREMLLRRGPGELSPPFQPDGRHSAAAVREWVDRAVPGATAYFDWTYRNCDDVEIPCEVHVVRLIAPGRTLIRGSILNVTERKRAEEALRESEARYRGLVNNASYGIYWTTLDGTLLDVNPALVATLGYESKDELILIRNIDTLFCDAAAPLLISSQFQKQKRVDLTVDWKRRDGKVITVRLIGRRSRDFLQKEECVETIVEDITERTALQKQLLQAQKFEVFGQLAGGIAHDFNNMIGAILGWAELGLEETEAETRLHRHFDKVRQQAVRAASLTRQLLAFARRQILEPRNIDLNHSISETLSLLEKIIGSNIEIQTRFAENLPLLRADPTQLEQILMNLCINSRDAMPDGGRLTIETAAAAFDKEFCRSHAVARPGHYNMLAVTDTGTGMDAATLDRVFEPFFTTKETGKGTGLGLATVYGIAQQHGGFLQVQSQLGAGSTFRVYLPIATVSENSSVAAEDASPLRGGSETILIAEDHEGLREIAREALSSLGYQVIVVCDGEQAVSEFRKRGINGIDLLLLDVVLPKVSGPEAYDRICAEAPGMPVIFATGYSPDIALLNKVQALGLAVLPKPYVPRELARRVREVLDRSAAKVQHALR